MAQEVTAEEVGQCKTIDLENYNERLSQLNGGVGSIQTLSEES